MDVSLTRQSVILPASGWLGRYFGRRRFLIACIGLFTFASAICGLADSLGMLIIARILQGIGGGALQPVSQAIMLETFPTEKRGLSMSVYSIGVVVAPILGPTLGGWLTDNYSWRWVFYINLPIGIFAIVMCLLFLEDPPYLKAAKTHRIDYIGFGLLVIWIGCLQILLDKGQDEDWFSSLFIRWLAVGASVGLFVFLVWELRVKDPIVDLRILTDRNLAIAVLLMFVVGAILQKNQKSCSSVSLTINARATISMNAFRFAGRNRSPALDPGLSESKLGPEQNMVTFE